MSDFIVNYWFPVSLGLILASVLYRLAVMRPKKIAAKYEETSIGRNASMTFEKIKAERDPSVENVFGKRPHRPVGKHPALAAPYSRPRAIVLTPRMLERVNIERRHVGKRPLNRDGIRNAVSHAANQSRQPDNSNDWLMYLILYENFRSDHAQSHCSGTGSVVIDPTLPGNGQGGEFGGAGASGAWTNPPAQVATVAAGIAVGASTEYLASQRDPDQDPKYKPGDEVGGYGNAEVRSYQNNPDYAFDEKPAARSEPMPEPAPQARPEPSYSPDPTPSAPSVSDSSSSYSSSSSSSYDSGSSSSGGGDSGGGGGGGGGD